MLRLDRSNDRLVFGMVRNLTVSFLEFLHCPKPNTPTVSSVSEEHFHMASGGLRPQMPPDKTISNKRSIDRGSIGGNVSQTIQLILGIPKKIQDHEIR